jgi:hypothetical protein
LNEDIAKGVPVPYLASDINTTRLNPFKTVSVFEPKLDTSSAKKSKSKKKPVRRVSNADLEKVSVTDLKTVRQEISPMLESVKQKDELPSLTPMPISSRHQIVSVVALSPTGSTHKKLVQNSTASSVTASFEKLSQEQDDLAQMKANIL